MKVITSASGKTSALIGSMVRQYFFRGDGGALVDKGFGPDLMEAMQSGEFQDSIVAHKADVVLVFPQRPNYSAERHLTLGEFYVNELFREVWCLPVSSAIAHPKKKGEFIDGQMSPGILSSFLMRGQSMEEFNNLLQPIEEDAFISWQLNPEVKAQYPNIVDYVQIRMTETLQNSIYSFTVCKGEGVKSYFYLDWSMRPPATDTEKEFLEIANIIASQYSNRLFNDVVEKAALKAAEGYVPEEFPEFKPFPGSEQILAEAKANGKAK